MGPTPPTPMAFLIVDFIQPSVLLARYRPQPRFDRAGVAAPHPTPTASIPVRWRREARPVFLRPVAAQTFVAKPAHYVHNIGHYSDRGMAKWMCLRIAVPWLLSAASAWHLKMRMMHSGLEKQKHNLCYCSWHSVNV